MAKLKLVGIVRVSGESQAKADTPEIQRSAIQQIALANDAEIVGMVDLTVTVSDLAMTPEWKALIVPILGDPDTHIAAYHTDRLARPRDWGKDWVAIEALRAAGKRVYFPGGVRDLGSEEGMLITSLEAMIAGGERRRIIKRSRDGKARHVRDGHCVSGSHQIPAGISYDKKTKTWGLTSDAEVVRLAFDLLVRDNLPYKEIARKVKRPLPTLRSWFTKDLYRGVYETGWRDEERCPPDLGGHGARVMGGEGQPPQLIAEATWDAAQRIVQDRIGSQRRMRSDDGGEHNLWSGALWSGHEPAPSEEPYQLGSVRARHVIWSKKTWGAVKTPAYVCRCQLEAWPDRCGLRSWPVDRLHPALDAYLAKFTSEDWFTAYMIDQLLSATKADTSEAERVLLQGKLDGLTRKLDRLEDLYLNDGISLPRYQAKREALRVEEADLKSRIKALTPEVTPTEADLRVRAMGMAWDPASPHEAQKAWIQRYEVRVSLANTGIDGVSLRLPPTEQGGSHGGSWLVPVRVSLPAISWVDLLGYDLADYFAVESQRTGLLHTKDVCALLGLTYDQLRWFVRSDRIQVPKGRAKNTWMWSASEIKMARTALGRR